MQVPCRAQGRRALTPGARAPENTKPPWREGASDHRSLPPAPFRRRPVDPPDRDWSRSCGRLSTKPSGARRCPNQPVDVGVQSACGLLVASDLALPCSAPIGHLSSLLVVGSFVLPLPVAVARVVNRTVCSVRGLASLLRPPHAILDLAPVGLARRSHSNLRVAVCSLGVSPGCPLLPAPHGPLIGRSCGLFDRGQRLMSGATGPTSHGALHDLGRL